MDSRFDRSAEDLGNIVALEHVNVTVPDQQMATTFYLAGLGLTRDPYLMTGTANMWINVGRSQFHLPTSKPQVLRGHTGIVVPDREALVRRLGRIRKRLEGTCFDFVEEEGFVEAKCPWGNRIRCFAPNERFGRITLGIAYVEFDVPRRAAGGIAKFYREVMGAKAEAGQDHDGEFARVEVGIAQHLVFRETDRALAPYDNHHIQIYVADFSAPYWKLLAKGLITEESDQHQYRFKDLADPQSGETLFTIEHEVRSMRHPLFMRPLVNRNLSQTNFNYAPGYDAWTPGMPQE